MPTPDETPDTASDDLTDDVSDDATDDATDDVSDDATDDVSDDEVMTDGSDDLTSGEEVVEEDLSDDEVVADEAELSAEMDADLETDPSVAGEQADHSGLLPAHTDPVVGDPDLDPVDMADQDAFPAADDTEGDGSDASDVDESSTGRRDGLIVGAVLLLLVLVLGGFLLSRGSNGPAYTAYGEEVSIETLQSRLEGLVDPELVELVGSAEDATPEQQAALAAGISTVITQDVMSQAAAQDGIEVTDADVDDQVEEIVQSAFGGDRAAFEAQIQEAGITEAGVRAQFRTALLAEGLVTEKIEPIDDAAIQQAYDENFSEATVSHILVETEAEAQDAIDRIDGGEPFADVASELSTDPGSSAQGGELGPLLPGQFVPEFEEAALALEPGEISEPVETQFGFHVITVGDPLPLEQVRDQIEQGLEDQRMNAGFVELAADLDEAAMVTVDPSFGTWGGLAQGIVAPQADLPLEDSLPEQAPTEG